MHQTLPIFAPGQLGRLAAILGVAVFLLGKTVHWHQECGGDRTGSASCSCHCHHHRTAAGPCSTDESDPAPRAPMHDCQQCVVCSLLAEVPDSIEFVTLEASAPLYWMEPCPAECLPEWWTDCSCSRGPPARPNTTVPCKAGGFVWG